MGNFLRFETMITPILIQIIFWLGVIACIVSGVMIIQQEHSIPGGLSAIILGPIMLRIVAEVLIVLFTINEHLREIQHNTQRI